MGLEEGAVEFLKEAKSIVAGNSKAMKEANEAAFVMSIAHSLETHC